MSNLPTVTSPIPNDLRNFINRVRETLGSGDLVTRDQLIKAGLVIPGVGGSLVPGEGNKIVPPAPTGLTASGALSTVILQWDPPNYSGHAYTEIWRAGVDDIGVAQIVGQGPGSIFPDPVGGNVSDYYWIRFVSSSGDRGAFNGTAGTLGEVGFDPAYLIDVLSANDPNALLYEIPADTVINGVPVAAGIYMRDLFFANGSVTNLKIGFEAVDDSKIANLSAAKVTFGEMSGERIEVKSLNADRIMVETMAAVLALINTAYISQANLQDAIIDNAKLTGPIYSDNWLYGTRGWLLNTDGNFYANSGEFRGNLVAAGGTFSGNLAAAGGTFSGGLNAATGTFRGNLSAAGGTFAGSLSAANGTFSGTLTASAINAVNTINIAGQAVTVSQALSKPLTPTFLNAVQVPHTIIATINFYTPNAGVAVIFGSVRGTYGQQKVANMELVVDGVVRALTPVTLEEEWFGTGNYGTAEAQTMVSFSAGNHTIQIKVFPATTRDSSGANIGAELLAILAKR